MDGSTLFGTTQEACYKVSPEQGRLLPTTFWSLTLTCAQNDVVKAQLHGRWTAPNRRWCARGPQAAAERASHWPLSGIHRVPFLAQQQEQGARRPPALAAKHTEEHAIAGAVGGAGRTPSDLENRARMSIGAIPSAAANGTSGSGASTFDVPQMWASSPSSGSSADGISSEVRHVA